VSGAWSQGDKLLPGRGQFHSLPRRATGLARGRSTCKATVASYFLADCGSALVLGQALSFFKHMPPWEVHANSKDHPDKLWCFVETRWPIRTEPRRTNQSGLPMVVMAHFEEHRHVQHGFLTPVLALSAVVPCSVAVAPLTAHTTFLLAS
jgi:hypothetical protein